MAQDLKTDIWVGALLRRAQAGGAFAAIVRKGDGDAGAVLVKVATMDGRAKLFAPARNGAGERIFLDLARQLGSDEAAIDAYARERVLKDPDLWIVEIEDRAARHFLTEPVE